MKKPRKKPLKGYIVTFSRDCGLWFQEMKLLGYSEEEAKQKAKWYCEDKTSCGIDCNVKAVEEWR